MSESKNNTSATKDSFPNILVIDDEPLIRETLREFLIQEGFKVICASSGEEGIKLATNKRFEICLCDLQLSGMDGIGFLQELQRISPEVFVVMITAYATVENAVEAFKRGAQDYLIKPIILAELSEKLKRLLEQKRLALENQWLRKELNRIYPETKLIGKSQVMRQTIELATKVAPTRLTILLTGESGTGKELLARVIHNGGDSGSSNPKEFPSKFLAVNCAAIPHDLLENQLFGHKKGAFTGADKDQNGVFMHAGKGTVFLDEIAELPLATQAKLLRAIELKEILPVGANEPITVEARILAATNKDLQKEVEAGRFREDLFYRLNVVAITIPPLRNRMEDIPELVEYLLDKHAKAMGKRFTGVNHEAMQILMACPWKGNVRELENVLQRAIILSDGPLISPMDLPPGLAPAISEFVLTDGLDEAVKRFEKTHIELVLNQNPDKREAAKKLKIALSSLYRRMTELGIAT
ncbi:MAG: sigma-54-dependent Fis family transcriptional regulator [Gemmataceae bacterium]|jgi:DNA-binding NtrC family response regulator|nr:sigma-54-dependent Fis family transcriptional regulator [Gemmataceae bacterium]MBJ7345723.1 sigma-54-dependent Fis family transcriptional regulator [Gemmataceae bacterium]MBJ7494917.1 sigma-54-dependent Fis family transcriptional regulator [Gemmataceae bacterium]RLS59719.1 MAG: sigma-54-dependent Fis family transcriptional regulator [Planctomycetota bacterium]